MRLFYTFLITFFLFCTNILYANNGGGGDALQRIITIDIKKEPLDVALEEIQKQGGFSFSYNPSILDLSQKVTFKGQNVTVKAVLTDIFGYHYEFRQVGNHVIIREALSLTIKPIDQRKRKTRAEVKRLKEDVLIKGRVMDIETGEGLRYVVVYDESQKVLTLTDSMGNYALRVPVERMQKGVYFRNRGYYDTMVQFFPEKEDKEISYNVGLTPYNDTSNPVNSDLALSTQNPHQLNLVKKFVPKKVDIISNEIEYTAHRVAQFTFIPFLSNNNFLGGSYTNRLSLNVYLGYSAGVDRGVEIGGLVNINRFHMKGFQVGGLSNIVGGRVHGFQASGLLNYDMETVKGIQVSGITNIVKDSVIGFQVSGINNVVRENVKGMQVSGIVNTTRTDVKGLQVGGIYNYSQYIKGMQVSGILNTNNKKVSGIQLSGIGNHTKEISGVQLSGIYNHISGSNKGVQLTSIYNYAKVQKGVQIGLINSAKDGKDGIPIGLFSFYKNGYHSFNYIVDEFNYINLSYQSGSRKFYNYYKIGMGKGKTNLVSDDLEGNFGLGFGSFIFKRIILEAGIEARYNLTKNEWQHTFVRTNLLYNQKIWKGISIFAGPSFNFDPIFNFDKVDIPPSFYSQKMDNGMFWISGSMGLKFTW